MFPCRNFNSIKVQLKLYQRGKASELAKFQFHKGTIKTRQNVINQTRKYISIP